MPVRGGLRGCSNSVEEDAKGSLWWLYSLLYLKLSSYTRGNDAGEERQGIIKWVFFLICMLFRML